MNGITEIRMRKIQSRTRQYRRRYEWREISCLTVCSLFLLAGIGILLGHIQEPGISSVAEGYGAVLVVTVGQVLDKIAHERENACIIGDGSQYQLTVAECVLDGLSHIGAGQIVKDDVGAALGAELIS